MTPLEQVERLYELHECERSFGEDLRAHLANGIVISTPTAFMMGRAVVKESLIADIRNPWHRFDREHVNAWYVYSFAGRVNTLCLQYFPFPLKWVAWERVGKNTLHFLDYQRFVTRCAQLTHS